MKIKLQLGHRYLLVGKDGEYADICIVAHAGRRYFCIKREDDRVYWMTKKDFEDMLGRFKVYPVEFGYGEIIEFETKKTKPEYTLSDEKPKEENE